MDKVYSIVFFILVSQSAFSYITSSLKMQNICRMRKTEFKQLISLKLWNLKGAELQKFLRGRLFLLITSRSGAHHGWAGKKILISRSSKMTIFALCHLLCHFQNNVSQGHLQYHGYIIHLWCILYF